MVLYRQDESFDAALSADYSQGPFTTTIHSDFVIPEGNPFYCSDRPQQQSTATIHSNLPQRLCHSRRESVLLQQPSTATIHSNNPQQPSTATVHSNRPQQPSTATLSFPKGICFISHLKFYLPKSCPIIIFPPLFYFVNL